MANEKMLNLFPARVPIGSASDAAGQNLNVYASPEFLRALSDLLARVGGPVGLDSESLALLGMGEAVAVDLSGLNDSLAMQALQAGVSIAEVAKRAEEALAQLPAETRQNALRADYLDLYSGAAPAISPGRLGWTPGFDTAQLAHASGLIQHIGHETFIKVINNTGVTITRGQVVSFNSISAGELAVQLFIADGSQPGAYLFGVAGENITNGATGKVTAFGQVIAVNTTGVPVGEVWAAGDLLYSHPTVAGALTKVRPTAPNTVAFVALVGTVNAATGTLFIRPVTTTRLDYGSFADTTTQNLAVINTAQAITFNTTLQAVGVARGAPTSRIVAARAGFYQVEFAAQLTSTSAATKRAFFWIRKNGVDVPNTTGVITISGASTTTVPSWSYSLSMAIGDYFEIMWAGDTINLQLENAAAPAFAPAIPSILMQTFQMQL